MSDRKPTNLRGHREQTDRNALIAFFVLLFIVGGGLIWLLYGNGAAVLGLGCIVVGAGLAAIVMLIMIGLQWLSNWLDRREMEE
jgi:hypothetical protein